MDNTDKASSVPAGAFWTFFLPSPRTGCHLLVLQSKSCCGVAVQGWWWWWRGAPAHLPGKFPGEQRTQSWAPFPSWPRRAAGEVWGAPGSTPPPGSPEAAARSLLSQIHLQVTQPEQGASLPCRAGARAGTYLAYLAAGITSPANPFLLSYSNARPALASPSCRQPPDPAPQRIQAPTRARSRGSRGGAKICASPPLPCASRFAPPAAQRAARRV